MKCRGPELLQVKFKIAILERILVLLEKMKLETRKRTMKALIRLCEGEVSVIAGFFLGVV